MLKGVSLAEASLVNSDSGALSFGPLTGPVSQPQSRHRQPESRLSLNLNSNQTRRQCHGSTTGADFVQQPTSVGSSTHLCRLGYLPGPESPVSNPAC